MCTLLLNGWERDDDAVVLRDVVGTEFHTEFASVPQRRIRYSMSKPNDKADETTGSPPAVPATGVLQHSGESASLDAMFAALRNTRRRYVIYYLQQRGELAVEELARLIAASETGGDHGAVPAEERNRVKLALVHVHLPKLVETGVVEYDERRSRVQLREELSELGPYLDEAAKTDLQ